MPGAHQQHDLHEHPYNWHQAHLRQRRAAGGLAGRAKQPRQLLPPLSWVGASRDASGLVYHATNVLGTLVAALNLATGVVSRDWRRCEDVVGMSKLTITLARPDVSAAVWFARALSLQ